MEKSSKEIETVTAWLGSVMYKHVGGCKFRISVFANGRGCGCGKAMAVHVWSLPGNFDIVLKWPVQARFSIELVNQQPWE